MLVTGYWTTNGIAIRCLGVYVRRMASKRIEIPAEAAHNFVDNMRAFFAEKDSIGADGIVARQLHALKQHYSGKLKLHDVKSLFHLMKDQL